VFRGRDLLRQGAWAEAAAEIAAGLADQQSSGARLALVHDLVLLAEARAAAGDLEAALALLDDALGHADRSGERWYDAELHRSRAAVLRRLGRDGDAAVSLARAVDVARSQGARLWELRGAHELARLWRDQGRCAEARNILKPVYGRFTEGFDKPDLEEAEALLRELA
jgi:predicted ATPase